jgi:hypothetical protein
MPPRTSVLTIGQLPHSPSEHELLNKWPYKVKQQTSEILKMISLETAGVVGCGVGECSMVGGCYFLSALINRDCLLFLWNAF